jgi:uncharacterized protein YheU (UPF0270 family)
MIIPHRMLSPEALRGVIEAFIVYDEATDSWAIQPTDQRSELP